jgi:hypothetical protein
MVSKEIIEMVLRIKKEKKGKKKVTLEHGPPAL